MYKVLNERIKGLLDKFRSGVITPAEFQDLKSELACTSDDVLENILSSEWNLFDDSMQLSSDKLDILYRGMNINSEEVQPRFSINRYWMGIAASLLFIIMGGLSLLILKQQEYINNLAQNNIVVSSGDYGYSVVTLPDGTKVRLNAKSSLTYAQNFGKENRYVKLSGEGFFEVKKNSIKKFIVDAGPIDITVHGTKFNVYAYEHRDFVEMSLVEGSVSVNLNKPPYSNIKVKPNEKVVYDKKSQNLVKTRSNIKLETAWMDKKQVFRNQKLENVFKYLTRKYNVEFKVEDEAILNDRYTGVFDDDNIDTVMEVLKIHYGFKYKQTDDIVYIYNKN